MKNHHKYQFDKDLIHELLDNAQTAQFMCEIYGPAGVPQRTFSKWLRAGDKVRRRLWSASTFEEAAEISRSLSDQEILLKKLAEGIKSKRHIQWSKHSKRLGQLCKEGNFGAIKYVMERGFKDVQDIEHHSPREIVIDLLAKVRESMGDEEFAKILRVIGDDI